MTRTQRQTTGGPPRARRSPSGSAATPQRSTPALRCRPLSSAELALVVGSAMTVKAEIDDRLATVAINDRLMYTQTLIPAVLMEI